MTMYLSDTARARSRPIPQQKEAWKVVNGQNRPLYYASGAQYSPGNTVVAKTDKKDGRLKWSTRGLGGRRTKHGIYVFLNEVEAIEWVRWNGRGVKIVRVIVNPKDFLFKGYWNSALVATYAKVKVPK